MNVQYDTMLAARRMTSGGVDQKTSEAVVSEIATATNTLVTKDDFHREMQLQNEKIGNKIFQAIIGSAGIIVVAQIALKAFGVA